MTLITDRQAAELYRRISFFRGGLKSTRRQKATPFDANRVRRELNDLPEQTRANYLRQIGAAN